MIATELAHSVITTERPVTMPQPRKTYSVNTENPADVVKLTWAGLAGLAGELVNNPPADLTADKASIIYGRLCRGLRNLQPMLTAVGALPPLQPPSQPARGVHRPFPLPAVSSDPAQKSAPSAVASTPSRDDNEWLDLPPDVPIETPEAWNARMQKEREQAAQARSAPTPNEPTPKPKTPLPCSKYNNADGTPRRFLFNHETYARMPNPRPKDDDVWASCYDAVMAGRDFRIDPL